MNADARELFTAAEIGAAIGKSRQAMRRALGSCPPSGKKFVANNLAEAWALADVPPEITAHLRELKTRYLRPSLAAVIAEPPPVWTPSIPLSRVCDADIRKATQLCLALSRAVAQPDEVPITERARLAADDFAAAFGYPVSNGHLRALITRTLERDAGACRFDRLELYLADNLRPRDQAPQTRARKAPGAAEFPELAEAFATIQNPATLTPKEAAYCWRRIVECFAARCADGADESRLKRDLRSYVFKAAPFLAKSGAALKCNLNRKLRISAESGLEAIVDRRAESSGHRRRPADWEQSIQLFAKWTRIRQGRESQAWRECHLGTTATGERFSEGFREYYPFDCRTAKSAVPSAVRSAIRPLIKATDDIAQGPRKARLNLPSIHRDWSDTAAGDYHTADDVTVNHYWFEEAEFGEYEFDGMRFNVGRGQWLILADERTDFPLGFTLLPTPQYNAANIKALLTRAWMSETCGLPFKGAKFENGIWRALAVKALFNWPEIDEGFGRFKINLGPRDAEKALRLRHATTPKAKIVERLIGTAQNMMDHLPGYAGRDEKKVCFERVKKFLQSLKRVGQPMKAELDPREMLLSKEEFADEVAKVMKRFSEEPQNGARMPGLSPSEAWLQMSPKRAHVILPESLRYLLATDRSEQTVTAEGIKLSAGRWMKNFYVSARLGELRGEKVEVYFNPEMPEHVSVIHRASDPRGVNPFGVSLFDRVPANTATDEDFARARRAQQGFAKYGKAAFRLLAPPAVTTLRDERSGTPELRTRGEGMAAIEREQIDLGRSRARHGEEIAALARRQNIGIDPKRLKNPALSEARLRENEILLAEIRRDEAASEDKSTT